MQNERHIVAIAQLATSIDAEAKALAADLGTTAYETRLKLAAGLPAIVLATTDDAAAQALARKLRSRGHRVEHCRSADVVRATAMVQLRRFELAADALVSGDARLPWTDISALVRARHQHRDETTTTVKQKKFDATRAVLTGGLVTRKTQSREVTTRTETTEQVLYVFRADGGTPWLLREHATHYGGLGAALAPTATQNFALAVAQLRARAPHAAFDDTLVRRPTIDDVDLYAHLVASACRSRPPV
ncbi:MAG: hypothetical protein ACM31C_22210 [Acidobacteriota bacterium]